MAETFKNDLGAVHPDYKGHLVAEVEWFDRECIKQSVPECFQKQVNKSPNQLAIKMGDEKITYGELNRKSNQVARQILKSVGKGEEPVALLFDHGPDPIIALIAALKAGKIFVPLDSTLSGDRNNFSMRDSGARLIITNTNNFNLAQKLAPRKEAELLDINFIDSGVSNENLDLPLSTETPAVIYYTSGSTGKPKGILWNHHTLHHRPRAFIADDHLSFLFSYSFAVSASLIIGGLLMGATLFPYDAKVMGLSGLAKWIIEEGITLFHPPNSLFREFIQLLSEDDYFPDIRQVNFGGQDLYRTEVEAFRKHLPPHCLIRNSLASTETDLISQIFFRSDEEIGSEVVPVGYETMDKIVLILDEGGKKLGFNQVGEIAVKSKYLSRGYWNDPDLTSEKFLPSPDGGEEKIFLSGDLGIMRPDRLLEYRGRKDLLVKILGHRVEISEVEAALQNIKMVREAVVIAQENVVGEKHLVAYIIPDSENALRTRALRNILRKSFPGYMIPARFVYVKDFPRTESGKPIRNALADTSYIIRDLEVSYKAPRDNLEKQLSQIWGRVTGLKKIGIDDDFFDLGGSSLQAMRVFVEIERIVGKRLPLSLLLKASTVAQQAEILRREDWDADWSSLVVVQPNGSAPPLFCFPGVGGNVLTFRDLSKHLGPDQPCYALQSRGLGGAEEPLTRIEDIAEYHLEEIKSVQPEGPYYLCGSSFGGMVAYELAQQLHRKGEAVAMVALFDTYGPDYPKKLPGITQGRMRLYRFAQTVEKHVRNLVDVDWPGKVSYMRLRVPSFFYRLKRKLITRYKEIRYPMPINLREVRKANIKASRYVYQPRSFGGRMVVFRASRQPFGVIPDPMLGWGGHGGEKFDVIEVVGNHDTLLWEPRIGEVAKKFKEYLIETQTLENDIS